MRLPLKPQSEVAQLITKAFLINRLHKSRPHLPMHLDRRANNQLSQSIQLQTRKAQSHQQILQQNHRRTPLPPVSLNYPSPSTTPYPPTRTSFPLVRFRFSALCFPASLLFSYRVRKLICPREARTGANTNVPPRTPALTATGRLATDTELARPAPCISQNIPRIAQTAISTPRITDVRKLSTPAAPAIRVSMCASRSCVPRQTKLHATRHLENHRFTSELDDAG